MDMFKWRRPRVPWSRKKRPRDQAFTKKWPWTKREQKKRRKIAAASKKKNRRK